MCSKDFRDPGKSMEMNVEKEMRGVALVPGLGAASSKSLDVFVPTFLMS